MPRACCVLRRPSSAARIASAAIVVGSGNGELGEHREMIRNRPDPRRPFEPECRVIAKHPGGIGDVLVSEGPVQQHDTIVGAGTPDRKSTRLNSSHGYISYAVFCL